VVGTCNLHPSNQPKPTPHSPLPPPQFIKVQQGLESGKQGAQSGLEAAKQSVEPGLSGAQRGVGGAVDAAKREVERAHAR
jgi:hypothetical protein